MKDMSINKFLSSGNLMHLTTYQAGVLQASSNRALQKFCDDVLLQYGISKMHWLIIGTIYSAGSGGIRITDLAKQLDTTLSYLTNTVNLLESKGFLSRHDSDIDSRTRLVSVDDKFIKKCDEIEKTLRKALRETIYADIDPEDFLVYLKVVYQLSNVKPVLDQPTDPRSKNKGK